MMKRRSFLKSSSIALAGTVGIRPAVTDFAGSSDYSPTLSLNAYSFNDDLLNGSMSLNSLFQFAARTGFSAVDLTAYYIPGYPRVPDDHFLYEIKRNAFRTGISFSGTGVRNNFTVTGQEALAGEIDLVKQWIVAASKLGAPNIRVFAGRALSSDRSSGDIRKQVVESLRECARFGARYGVTVSVQNHFDYLVSTDDIIDVVKRVDSDWFGLMLDIGSVAGPDPYSEIEKLIPYAFTWQIKEEVRTGTGTAPVDLKRLMDLIRSHHYQGFLPLETLGEGDPARKVEELFQKVAACL